MTLNTDGVLDIDIPAVKVQGSVTLKGAQMPLEQSDRGNLEFVLTRGGSISTDNFGAGGAVTYSVTLIPGNYTVIHRANPSLCNGSGHPKVPCLDQVLAGCP
jgi:hypothetical protein